MLQETELAAYINTFGEQWADELPDKCPPNEVCVANDDVFFRMTLNKNRMVPEDWMNYLTLYPNANYSNEQRIYAAGLSIMDSQKAAEDKMKLPWIKKKGFKGLAMISLIPEDGVILQTFDEKNHFTWWRTKNCNLEKAKMI